MAPIDAVLYERLRGVFPDGATVVRIDPLAGDASTRSYFRAALHDGTTAIVMLMPEPRTATESSFIDVHGFLERLALPVPRIHAHDPDRGVILLEDLGDELLETAVNDAPPDRTAELYRDAVDLLLEMRRRTAGLDSGCCAFCLAFDEEKLLWEMDFFMEHFVRGLCSLNPPESALAELNAFFRKICTELAAQPRIFTHRDYHSRNLLLPRGRLVMIDFQDARMGPAQYDLASLLYDSYVELPYDLIEELVTHYADAAGEESAEHFFSIFYVMALQRNIKALGTFGYQTAVRRTDRYLSAIPRTAGYIARNIARCPDLASFVPVVRDYICGPAAFRSTTPFTRGNDAHR